MKTVFLRALEAEDKAAALRRAIQQPAEALGTQRFEVGTASFAAVPRSPFSYWVSERLRALFKELPPFESNGRSAKVGVQTSDDFRFVRGWWALSPKLLGTRWLPFTKGGTISPVYSDVRLCLVWQSEGHELKAFAETTPGTSHWSRNIRSIEWYRRPGFSWALRTSRFAPSCVPAGCIFSVSRYQAFVDEPDILATIGLLNGSVCSALLRMCSERYEHPKFIIGIVQSLPFPSLPNAARDALQHLTRRVWSLKRSLDAVVEISHSYVLPALLTAAGDSLASRVAAWRNHVQTNESELASIYAEIDNFCFDLYGIDETDRRSITEGFAAGELSLSEDLAEPEIASDVDDPVDDNDSSTDALSLTAALVSWAVGVACGRFDMRLATGARDVPAEPEPFDSLPVCSPAMLTGDNGLPLMSAPVGYPERFPENGIFVDDPGDERDLTAAVRVVFEKVFETSADRWRNEIEATLDPKNHDLQGWLAKNFFDHHLKRHSWSRRKAPIIWQLATPSCRYSIWLYAHRLSRDSIIQIQNDVVTPKLAHEERHLASLMQSAGANPDSKESKEIERQEAFVGELRVLLEKVKRVAPLWHPTLDDGVVLTMAPLWRLVPQHKPWQKELKCKWDEMVAGKYDWAHVAMHLWPERVIPKCAEDRSLAIAHGLEDVFWFEDEDGKWKPYEEPRKPIDKLISDRTSTAVKAALKNLLDAPEPASGAKRSRKSKAA